MQKRYADSELLNLLSTGDEKAFTEIYNRYWKRLFSFAASRTGDLEDAEEIVQDIFVSLWRRREKIVLTSSLNSYLSVSVKYRVIKTLGRRYTREKYTSELDAAHFLDDSTREWIEFDELRERLSKLVARLPEKCRLVYRLSREEGYSQKQIARELDISEKTVEAHLGKALKTLRAGLQRFLLSLL